MVPEVFWPLFVAYLVVGGIVTMIFLPALAQSKGWTPENCPCMNDVCWYPAVIFGPILLWPLIIVSCPLSALFQASKTAKTLCGIPLPAAWRRFWAEEAAKRARDLESGEDEEAVGLVAQQPREGPRMSEESGRASVESARSVSSLGSSSTLERVIMRKEEEQERLKSNARDYAQRGAGQCADGLGDVDLLPEGPPPAYDT